jgi:hypothetical protein
MPPAECPAAAIRAVSIRPRSGSPALSFSASMRVITSLASDGWFMTSTGSKSRTR